MSLKCNRSKKSRWYLGFVKRISAAGYVAVFLKVRHWSDELKTESVDDDDDDDCEQRNVSFSETKTCGLTGENALEISNRSRCLPNATLKDKKKKN